MRTNLNWIDDLFGIRSDFNVGIAPPFSMPDALKSTRVFYG